MALTRVTSGGINPGVVIRFDQNNTPTTPAISFYNTSTSTHDADTGIYSPAANTIAISTAGVKRFEIGPDGTISVGTTSNPAYLPVTNSAGPSSGSPNGKTLYVNCNDSNADDTLANNGENLNRPFKTIERALIEAGRKSYVPGTGVEAGQAGADKFEFFTIIVYPGQYEVDNRPGVFQGSYNSGNPVESWQGDYSSFLTANTLSASDYYKFNAADGGVILPRGTSIVGLDLRKTVIRPKYVPDASTGSEGAIFRLTGGCYVWQMTIKDSEGQPYYNQTQQYSNANRSHQKLVGFKFATIGDLAAYYRKVDQLDGNIPSGGGSTVYELFQRTEENRIVGSTTSASEIDTVASASPYVFNCSLRSVWGMCGMHADGATATGFRSMVVAQYTGISLQKDDRAFYLNGTSTSDIVATDARHTNPLATYRKTWRHFHVKASNSSFIQIVSVFAVGFADHFLSDSGGDMSITNSNSNFGNTSLRAIGNQNQIFDQNNKGRITALIPPKGIDTSNPDNIANVTVGFVSTQQTLGISSANATSANATNSNFKVLYLGQPIKRSEIPEIRLNEGTNASPSYKRYLVFGNSYQYTLGKKTNEKLYLDFSSGSTTTTYQEPIRFSQSSNDPSYNAVDGGGITIGNEERQGYGWTPASSGTITDSTLGYLYIKLTYAPNASSFASGDNGILKKLFNQNGTTTQQLVTQVDPATGLLTQVVQNVTVYAFDYFYGISTQPYCTRLDDTRGTTGGTDLIWRLEYTIPSTQAGAKPPEARYLLYPKNYENGQGGYNKSFWIYDVETYQDYKYGVSDGIYYLTVMRGNVDELTATVNGNSTADFPVSQNINYLYPTINQDAPEWNPASAVSKVLVEGSGSSARSRDVATNYIGTVGTSTYPYATPDFYSITRETINEFITSFSPALTSGVTTAAPYGSGSAFNTTGKQELVQQRKISLTSPLEISIKRSSIIRASSHTWEYMGFGPGNYSTSFPNLQTTILDRYQIINSQGIEHAGGFVASTGTNSQGEFYIGNQIIRSGSDKTETLNIPQVKYSSETRLIDYSDISNQLTNSLITSTATALQGAISNVQAQLQGQISGLSQNFITNNLTVTSALTSNGTTTLNGDFIISDTQIANNSVLGFPKATTTGYGFVKKTANVADAIDADNYISPADLEQWRIAKGIQTTTGTASNLNYIYIQPYRATTVTQTVGVSDTTINVQSTDGFDSAGVLEIEKTVNGQLQTEVIKYTGKTQTAFTGCTRAFTHPNENSYNGVNASGALIFSGDGSAAVFNYDRYAWEEPYVTSVTSPIGYKSPRKVSSYTSSIDSYIAANYIPNPQAAKDYGVNLQTLQPVKRFVPFASLAQASEWARKNGFGAADTVYCVMKPGYYEVGGGWNSNVVIGSYVASVANNNLGDINGNDGIDNRSVFLYRKIGVYVGHPTYYYAQLGAQNSMTCNRGLTLQHCYVLSTDQTYAAEGIPNSDFQYPNSRQTAKSAAVGSRYTTYLSGALNEYRTNWNANAIGTLQTAITAGESITTGAPKTVTIDVNGTWWLNPAVEGQGTGGIKIGNEVFDYVTTNYGDGGTGVQIQLIRRAREGTSAAAANVGDTVYAYFWRAGSAGDTGYVDKGNKFVPYYSLSGASSFMSASAWLYVYNGTLALYNASIGAYYPYSIATVGLGGGDSAPGMFLGSGATLVTAGLRLKGNERWDLSTFMNGWSTPQTGFEYSLFNLSGNVTIGAMSYGFADYSTTQQGENFYGLRTSHNYMSGIFLEPIEDPNGNTIRFHDGCHGSSLAAAVTTSSSTISGYTAQLRAWPSSGKAMICGQELISYTAKSEQPNGITNLTGVTRNIGWYNNSTSTPGTGSVPYGSAGQGGPWPAGTSLRIAPPVDLSYYNTNETRWMYPLGGFEAGANDATEWKKRGPFMVAFWDMWEGADVKLTWQYSIWSQYGISNANGFNGKFGQFSNYGTRTTAWRFKSDGISFKWSNQYHDNFFKVGGPAGSGAPSYPSISNPTLQANCNATDTTIYITRTDVNGTVTNALNLVGGVIKIDSELIYVGSVSDDSGNNRIALSSCSRGWNRTVAASHTSGAAVGYPSGVLSGGRTYVRNYMMNINQVLWTAGIDLNDGIQTNRNFWM